MIDWLKSLRPQNKWKPSEEQIKVLQELCKYSEVANLTEKGVEILKSLYNDIKKLTE
jgi:CTP-dependent riboflavin kinase